MTAVALLLADDWGNHMDGWGAGWWVLMVLMMVVFWGLVIFAVVWLARSLSSGRSGVGSRDPIEVLEHRLAAGEISAEEYRERRAVLEGKEAGPGS